MGLGDVLQEWQALGHGRLGPLLRQTLPLVKAEACSIAEEIPWKRLPVRALRGWLGLCSTLYQTIDARYAPRVPRLVTVPGAREEGNVARCLFVLDLWWHHRDDDDPSTWLLLVYLLAEMGPRAARELERRVTKSKEAELARLALTMRLPFDPDDPNWAALQRLLPGMNRESLAAGQVTAAKSLPQVSQQLRGRLPSSARAWLAREDRSGGGSRDDLLRMVYEALRGLPTDEVLVGVLGRRRRGLSNAVAAATATDEVRQLEEWVRRHRLVADEGALDEADRKARSGGRRRSGRPMEITLTLEEDSRQEDRSLPRKELLRAFLKSPQGRKHAAGVRYLLAHRDGKALKTLARRDGVTVQTIINRRERAREVLQTWVRTGGRVGRAVSGKR